MGSVAIQEDLSLDERVRLAVQAFAVLPKEQKLHYRLIDEGTFNRFGSDKKLVVCYNNKARFVMEQLDVDGYGPSRGEFSDEDIIYAVLLYCAVSEKYARETLATPEFREILGLVALK